MNREERIEHLREWSSWELAEHAVELEEAVHAFMDLDDSRCKLVKKLEEERDDLKLSLEALEEESRG